MLGCVCCAVERKLLGAVLYGDDQIATSGQELAQIVIELRKPFEQKSVIDLEARSSCRNGDLDASGCQESLDLRALLRDYGLVLVDEIHDVLPALTTEHELSIATIRRSVGESIPALALMAGRTDRVSRNRSWRKELQKDTGNHCGESKIRVGHSS